MVFWCSVGRSVRWVGCPCRRRRCGGEGLRLLGWWGFVGTPFLLRHCR